MQLAMETVVKMRILIVGREAQYNAEFFYKKAFSKLGNDVSMLNSYNGISNQFLTRMIHSRTGLFNYGLEKLWINRNIIRETEELDPDCIIFIKGDLISTRVLSELAENRKIYLLYPDTYKFETLLRKRLEYFTSVFTAANNKQFYYMMGAKVVVTVPWACDPDFHRRLSIEKKYNISFIGTAYPERRKIIRKIGGTDVFGNVWYGFGTRSHRPVYGEDFVKVINQSKINLNLQARISIEADAPTMRTFEVAGCGGFQISDYMPSLKKYFPMLPTFNDIEELKGLISYYLKNPEEADEIGQKTMEICHSSFKYTDAAKTILSNL